MMVRMIESCLKRPALLTAIFFGCLAAIAVLGLVARPDEPHIAVERLPLFWSLFGLAGCTGLALVCKWIARVLLERKSDYYDS